MSRNSRSPKKSVLLTAESDTGSIADWPGGRTNVEISGCFFGAKVQLERRLGDSEWRTVKEVGIFVSPVFRVVGRLPKGSYRVKVTGGSTRTKLNVTLMRMLA